MSSRPRRFTSSRSITSQKRRPVADGEYVEEEKTNLAIGKNWFYQQSPSSQVYYMKIAVGFIAGIVGILYDIPIFAGNWFIFPLICLAGVYVATRSYLGITKDDIDDFKLLAWHGTISLFISFIISSALIHMIINPPQFIP